MPIGTVRFMTINHFELP